jgi:hypothetical protein
LRNAFTNRAKIALFDGKTSCFAVSDALIDHLNGFEDTRLKSIVQGFLPNSAKNLALEQFKNAVKELLLLRF